MKRMTLPLIALGLALLITQIAHAESATMRISPATQNVPAGQIATVELQVEGITDPDGLASYEFAVTFDPAQLDFVSFTNSAFLGSTGRSVLCLPVLFDRDGDTNPDPGYVRAGCITQATESPPQGGPTGSGMLATITFETLCPGTSPLEFDRASLGDPLANTFDLGIIEAAITVTGTPCEPPVPAGDANCDGDATAVDAALILQLSAGIVDSLECEDAADVNGDGAGNSIDAALVLQFAAGIIDSLSP